MQACFHKLKQLVPTVPHDRKLSKVALLQHVIDYILDLEVTLDFKPSEESAKLLRTALEQTAAAAVARKPLSESSSRINMTHSLQVRIRVSLFVTSCVLTFFSLSACHPLEIAPRNIATPVTCGCT